MPNLKPGDLVVMDNLGAHHATGVQEAIGAAGADVLYMPPYSPDLNPIEHAWSKLKALLKAIGARTVLKLRHAVTRAAEAITQGDAEGWYRHCGYPADLRCDTNVFVPNAYRRQLTIKALDA